MRKFKSYMLISIPIILSLLLGACTQSPTQDLTATPVEIPKEASPGEYINVIIKVASNQPCKIILTTPHKTEIDNYLAPYTTDTLTYPNSDGTVVFHEQIPWETIPGDYILKVFQMTHDSDQDGKEIFSQGLIVQ